MYISAEHLLCQCVYVS